MRAALFPGQGLDPGLVSAALTSDHPRVAEAEEILGYELAARVAQVARRSGGVLPTSLAQPAIFVAGIASFETSAARGEAFDCFLGHSLGEYTALVAAGSISFRSGLEVVAARGAAMERVAAASPGAMAAVLGLSLDEVAKIAATTSLTIANDNSPVQAVLSGPPDRLAAAASSVRGAGGRSVLLPIDGAFHSGAMVPAAADLAQVLLVTEIRSPARPVISNLTASPYRAPGEIRKLLVRQLTERVRFRECLRHLHDRGVREFVDVGPGDVVGRLARATLGRSREALRA